MTARAHGDPISRRRFLGLGGVGIAAGLLLSRFTVASAQTEAVPIGEGHTVLPRDAWGADLPPVGEMAPEAPGDVRFLLVHHSASPNDYSAEQSVQYLRSFYRYHTSDEKGWHDIAYNFLVDRYGRIFEGRQGSIAAPIRGDATGGSQGYALLACFIGDHRDVAPTAEAQSAMVALLAWMAGTYEIATEPGSKVKFISRGSNLHPPGKEVVTPTITGHRTMSRTTCPGDLAFDLVENSFPESVTAVLSGTHPASAPTSMPSSGAATIPSTSTPTSEAVEAPGVAVDAPTDTGGVGVVSTTLPVSPATTEPSEPSTPPSPSLRAGAGEDSAGAAPTPVSQDHEAPAGRSRQIVQIIWNGIGTAILVTVLWLRHRLDPITDGSPGSGEDPSGCRRRQRPASVVSLPDAETVAGQEEAGG